MKLRVLFDRNLAPSDFLLLFVEDPFEVGDLISGDVCSCMGGQRRLDHLANIQQLRQQCTVAEEESGQRRDEGVSREVTYDRPFALPRFD